MAVIQSYDDHVTAQGGIGVRASGADFGAQVGSGLQQVGQGMEALAQTNYRIEQDEGRIWAYKASSDAYEQLRQGFTEKVNALDPQDPDFTTKVKGLTDNFKSQIDQSTSDLMSSAPSRSASKIVASHMALNGRSLINGAINETARVMGQYTLQQINDGIKKDQDSVAADPSNGNYIRILQNRKEMVSGLSLDPAKKLEFIDKIEHGIALAQVQVLSATDKQGFLQMVGAQGGELTKGGRVKGAVPGGPGGAPSSPTDSNAMGVSDSLWSGVIGQESGGKQFKEGGVPLTSDKGAIGIAQVMPGTGPEAAKLAGLPWDQRRFYQDAGYNEALGRAYFGQQLKTFGGDVAKALAAYNMGPGSANAGTGVRGLVAKHGDNWLAFAPKETQNYVSSIMSRQSQGVQTAAVDNGVVSDAGNGLPQIQPLTDQDVANAKPQIAGWDKLTWQEKVKFVREAEAGMGGDLANQRGEISRALGDIQATLLSGQSYPGIEDPKFSHDNLVRVFGQDAGERAYDKINYAKQVGGFIGQMSTMPDAQAQQMLESLKPQGGVEYAARSQVYNAAVTAYANLSKLRNDDYMAWAQSTSGVAANVKPIDFSSPANFQQTLTTRITPATTGRQDYGANAHLMSNAEAEQLGTIISRMNPQDQMAYLKSVRQATVGHDDWFTDTLRQIAPKNTMLAFAADTASRPGMVQTDGGPQSGQTVGQYVLEGAHILQGKDIDDPQKSGRPLQIDDNKVRNFFWQQLGSNAFQSPDATHSAQAANDTYQAVKNYMVADMYHRGVTPDHIDAKLVGNAISAVTGGTAKVNSSTMFLPWGTSKDTFQKQFPIALDMALQRSGIKGGPLDAPDSYQYANVGDGKYLVMNNSRPLVSNGRTVVVDMSSYAGGAGAGRGFNWGR